MSKAGNKTFFVAFLLAALFVTRGLVSQESQIDSLKRMVQEGSGDSTQVNNLNALSVAILQEEDISGSLQVSRQAGELADELRYLKGKAYAEKNIGMAYYYQGDYMEVLDHWTKSLEIFEAIEDSQGIANMANNLGAVYYSQGSNSKAIDYYLRSLSIAEKIQDTLRIASALLNIGGVYGDTPNDYDKALEYFNRIPQYLPALNEPQITTSYLMGEGEIYLLQGNYREALKYYEDALPLTLNTADNTDNLTKLGIVEFKMGEKSKAISYLDQAFQIAKKNNQQLQMVQTLIELGKVYQNDNFTKALNTFKEAESLANEMGTKFELKDIFEGLSIAYANQGDYTNAFKYQTQLIAAKDSLFNVETDDKIRGLQFDFDLEKKEDEIGLLEQEAQIADLQAKRQKYVIYGTVLGLLLVFMLAVGSYKRYRYVKKTNKIIEEEKNRSENLLLNILPDETALELKQNGKVKAKKFESVTVMFTDFKGFTSYSQNLSPELLVKTVDYYFSKFDAIMEKYDLEKIKTIGDAYMCAGGLPFPTKDHPYKMVQAAFEIAQVMEETRLKPPKDIVPFDVRIGINTGVIIAGVVGTRKFAYDIWGDTVNVAARMESLSEPGKVNVSQSTYLLIRDRYNCEHRGQIHVKNKGMMDMYFVNEKKEEPSIKAKKEKIINI
ncbi:MAG: adenylate/guanylate cyclase domain-containing protein [Eudoraea sp.]|uniref:adenylate/guanylate cyclase domain-containing protein n=1 Tax=Eudoraea sp. TaxID=1979955 RepID=UPI003264B2A7